MTEGNENKKECEIALDLLPLYVDDVVSNISKEFVEKHIKECEECKKVYLEYKNPIISVKESIDNTSYIKAFQINKKREKRIRRIEMITVMITVMAIITSVFYLCSKYENKGDVSNVSVFVNDIQMYENCDYEEGITASTLHNASEIEEGINVLKEYFENNYYKYKLDKIYYIDELNQKNGYIELRVNYSRDKEKKTIFFVLSNDFGKSKWKVISFASGM